MTYLEWIICIKKYNFKTAYLTISWLGVSDNLLEHVDMRGINILFLLSARKQIIIFPRMQYSFEEKLHLHVSVFQVRSVSCLLAF